MTARPTSELSPSSREAMLRADFGLVARLVGHRFFEPIVFPAEGEAQLRRLAAQGEVVHVMRTAGVLNFLYLAWALLRRGLPPLRAVIGLAWTFWRPFRRTYQEGPVAQRLAQALGGGASALFFLRERTGSLPRLDAPRDPLHALLERARRSQRPIYLVPEMFLWRTRARNVVPTLRDLLFGDPEAPGMLVTAWSFLLNYRNAFIRVGAPLDLTAVVREHPGEPDAVLTRRVRGELLRELARDTRAIVGPPRKSPERIIEHTLRDRTLKATLERLAAEQRQEPSEVRREARRHLEALAARQSPVVIAGCKPPLTWVFNRLHAGVEVDEAGLQRALHCARQAPVVYCPSHKSHLDYLVMAWVLYARGIMPPLVAAGANLSFWPLGPFFAHGGAFFLRRSFKGDRVYGATFKAYIKQLLREGYSQEFFIEGGRSRTGKLLPPKLGLLSFEVDAFLEGVQQDVCFVPVAIDYETVLEAKSYARELAGGEKKPESLRSLLAAPKVLAHHYGRIYLSFEEPISLRDFLVARVGGELTALSPEARRASIRALAQRITFGISRASTLTPAALLAAALLGTRGRGAGAATLAARIDYLRALARRDRARLSPVLAAAPSDPTRPGPLNEVLRRQMEEGLVEPRAARGDTVYAVPAGQRASLNFYKNNLIHLVANRALVATGLLSFDGPAERAALAERVGFLARLFKFELAYPVGIDFAGQLDAALAALASEGCIRIQGTRLAPVPGREGPGRANLEFLRELLRDLLESYRLFFAAVAHAAEPLERKELIRRALERAQQAIEEGTLRCPEALSKPTLENALAVALENGLLLESGDHGKRVALAPGAEGAVASHLAQLDRLLR